MGEKKISAREKNQKKYQKPFSLALFIFSGKKKHCFCRKISAVFTVVIWPVFFLFTRENEKCPRKRFLAIFLFFSSGRFFFSRPLLLKFSRAVWSFLGDFFVFFLGGTFFFSGRKLRIFSGRFFFSRAQFFQQASRIFSGRFFFSQAESFQQASTFQRVKSRFTGVFLKIPTGSDLLL